MTRDEFEATLKQARKFGGYGLDPFFESLLAHDDEQRQIIDEQVEENRGLRSDVLLTQAANAEQRQRIEELEQQNAALREALDWGGLRVSDEQVSQALKELGQTGTRAESYIKAVVEYAVHMRAKASQALKECR